jgi:hypothetical protein
VEAFEKLVGGLLERQGYWVRYGFKVELSKREKARIGRPSSPRWELDILAYSGGINKLLVVECKSYLDSPGVRYLAVAGPRHKRSNRYKLFNDVTLRRVVLSRLVRQLAKAGACRKDPAIILCLAAGKVVSKSDAASLRGLFKKRGWQLFDSDWIRRSLSSTATLSYEDDVAAVVAKLLLRNHSEGRGARLLG